MMNETEEQSSQLFRRSWDHEYATNRRLQEYDPYLELQLCSNASNDCGKFLSVLEKELSSFEVDEIEKFKGNVSVADVLHGTSPSARRHGAWLNDAIVIDTIRENVGGSQRSIATSSHETLGPGIITSQDMLAYLGRKRFEDPKSPERWRRLIFVRDLDPYFLVALAEPAEVGHIPVLGGAIWNHIALQTSLQAERTHGFRTFRMQLHLPMLGLRTQSAQNLMAPSFYQTLGRKWIDLRFLDVSKCNSARADFHGIQETHFSLVISGTTDSRWCAYAFADSFIDDDDLEDQVLVPDASEIVDPIADGNLLVENSICNPAWYFIRVADVRLKKCLQEWNSIVKTLERSLEQYGFKVSSALFEGLTTSECKIKHPKNALDSIFAAIKVLGHLLQTLAATVEVGQGFLAADGDVVYLLQDNSGTKRSKIGSDIEISIESMKRTIKKLGLLKATLERLRESCRNSAKDLQLRIQVESAEAIRNSGHFAQFGVTTISPITVAIAFYSIPEESAPIKLEKKYFIVAVVIMIALVRLLSLLVTYLPDEPWKWRRGYILGMRLHHEISKYVVELRGGRGTEEVAAAVGLEV